MAVPTKQQPSRWGSFLQQAVAGVESRLDNILTEGPDESGQPRRPLSTSAVVPGKPDGGSISRSSSNSNRTNDRLQERLARAVAAKNGAAQPDAHAVTLDLSAANSQLSDNEITRPSLDASSSGDRAESGERNGMEPDTGEETGDIQHIQPRRTDSEIQEQLGFERKSDGPATNIELGDQPLRPLKESTRPGVPRTSTDSFERRASDRSMDTNLLPISPTQYEARLKQLQADLETLELQKQEEIHDYIERIDTLEAKLHYLVKESAESARRYGNSAPPGSFEQKLADKEEQVALLMDEGQKLSKKELSHLTTIKKLRMKIQEHNKDLAELRKKQEKAEKDASFATDRWKRTEASEKQVAEKQRLIVQLHRDVESLKAASELNDSTIADLKSQLKEEMAQGKQSSIKLANESLDLEKKRVADLEEDVANLKIQNSLVTDRAQARVKELQEKISKDAENTRIVEMELKSEQQALESKLEIMRARAEEVSSGATGDAQAKLLRQIETLQTQYVVASENWQGIEASLIARATSLEKERDEATRRETDIRRKAREVALKAKRYEDELEETRSSLPRFEEQLAAHKTQLDTLQKQAKEAELALAEARTAFDQDRQAWQAELLQRLDEEKQKWHEEAAGRVSRGPSRANSPIPSTRRGLTSEYLGLQNLQIRRASARSIHSDVPTVDRVVPRRPSAQPLGRSSGHATPTRQDSVPSTTHNGEVLDTPSLHTDHDDFFENHVSPASPDQTMNDLISVSTAAAGPSVQLVERMSSAIRRLESEKVAAKEDLVRISAQRDEARAEIVALMKEVEAKTVVSGAVAGMEAEIEAIKSRYETTLEMLGEKSELVDELRGDIVDIKAMYRELVERTVT